jgi:predicted nucleotidyltransferase component of viral defense system
MTKPGKKNPEASIHARLLNISKESGENFNALLNRFFQERFLARLSISEYRDTFILKGGLLLAVESISQFRPTIDIDILAANLDNDVEIVLRMIMKIANIPIRDSVRFDTGDIRHEALKADDEYEGIRIKLGASLGKTKTRIQIDIGFGDDVPLGFKKREFPVFLKDFKPPILWTYPLESVIAEKLQAIVSLGEANSRMKDFYDILFLAEYNEFTMGNLKTAIKATFDRRKTDIEEQHFIYKDKYVKLKAGNWKS